MEFRISVVIPVYNRVAIVEECLDSVVATAYPNLEVLVIDDGSTDGTFEAVKSYQSKHSDIIRVLTHPDHANFGVSASRNLGILAATGQYICFIDSDDLMLPYRFDAAVEILDEDETIDGVVEATDIVFIEPSDAERWDRPLRYAPAAAMPPGEFLRATLLDRTCAVLTPGLLVRRRLFQKTGLYSTERILSEDFHMWLRMAACGRFRTGEINIPVALYRRHGRNTWVPDRKDSVRDLDVLKDVLRWARRSSHVTTQDVSILEDAFRNKLYHCLTLLRGEQKKSQGMQVARTALKANWLLLFEKRFASNVARLLLGN